MHFDHQVSILYPVGYIKWFNICQWLNKLGEENYRHGFHTSTGFTYHDFYFRNKEIETEFKLRFG